MRELFIVYHFLAAYAYIRSKLTGGASQVLASISGGDDVMWAKEDYLVLMQLIDDE